MLTTIIQQGNENQNYSDIPQHIHYKAQNDRLETPSIAKHASIPELGHIGNPR